MLEIVKNCVIDRGVAIATADILARLTINAFLNAYLNIYNTYEISNNTSATN